MRCSNFITVNYILVGELLSKQIFHLRVKKHFIEIKSWSTLWEHWQKLQRLSESFTGKANNINFTRGQKPTRNLNHFNQVTELPTKLMFDISNTVLYSPFSFNLHPVPLSQEQPGCFQHVKLSFFNHHHTFALLILRSIFTSIHLYIKL